MHKKPNMITHCFMRSIVLENIKKCKRKIIEKSLYLWILELFFCKKSLLLYTTYTYIINITSHANHFYLLSPISHVLCSSYQSTRNHIINCNRESNYCNSNVWNWQTSSRDICWFPMPCLYSIFWKYSTNSWGICWEWQTHYHLPTVSSHKYT